MPKMSHYHDPSTQPLSTGLQISLKQLAPQVFFLHQAMAFIRCLAFLFLFHIILLQIAAFFIVFSYPVIVFSCKISIAHADWLTSMALFPKPWCALLKPA